MVALPTDSREEAKMTDSTVNEWRQELKVLLDNIEHHPSADLAEQRERVVVLRQLLADHDKTTAG
jgi:hypothetical protein